MTEPAHRTSREKVAYNDGGVVARSARLQARFEHVFLCPNAQAAEHALLDGLDETVPGAFVLDYGCFTGQAIPVLSARAPAAILGIDISQRAVGEAKSAHGERALFSVMDGHRLALADRSIDLVVGRAILHHLDFDVAIHEIQRVLRPGGHAFFVEPLRDNPAGKLVRLLTPGARTRDELPLSREQILRADTLFETHRHVFAGFASVACGLASSLVSGNPANVVMRLAHRVDLLLARSPARWWMRSVVLHWTR